MSNYFLGILVEMARHKVQNGVFFSKFKLKELKKSPLSIAKSVKVSFNFILERG